MKVIEHSILVKCAEDQYVLINCLTGSLFVVSSTEMEIIEEWKNAINDVAKNKHPELFSLLKANGFIVSSPEEEIEIVKRMVENCRKIHDEYTSKKTSATFVLTYMCNFACPYCYEGADKKGKLPVISKKMVDAVFDLHSNNLENIGLYGGEPLLPETKDVVAYILSKAPEASYNVTTNGYYLEDYVGMFKKVKINYIMITIDGLRDRHNTTRIQKNGEGSFDRIQDGIRACLENGITVKIRMNISPENMKDCSIYRDKLIERYGGEYENGLLMFELQPIFQLNPTVRSTLEDKIYYGVGANEEIPFSYNTMTLTTSSILRPFVRKGKGYNFPMYCSCDAEESARFYDSEGYVYSCILSLGKKETAIGKYYPVIEDIIPNITMRNIESIEKCRTCIKKFLCGSGCSLESFNMTENCFSPNCLRIDKEIYEDLPRLLREKTGK